MKTRVSVAFPASKADEPTWPYMNYDVEERSNEVLLVLGEQLPDFEFVPSILHSVEEAEDLIRGDTDNFDGYLVYMTSLWTKIEEVFARKAYPVVIADDPFAGSGGILSVNSIIRRESLPVVTVSSSNFGDVVDAVRLFEVMKRLRESRILVVTDRNCEDGRVVEPLGTKIACMNSVEFRKFYDGVPDDEAKRCAESWISGAKDVIEPDEDEITRSAKIFLAMREAMSQKNADAITVDCLGLYYSDKLPAYPCLGFFQLNNEGSTGVCEADTRSTLCQLVFRYLTGRPAYVSDPVIDTAANQIVYAHCVSTNRVFGPGGLSNPYVIRSHAEDLKGASVQSLMPLGEAVTTIQINPEKRAISIHNAETVANIHDEKGCRTKLAATVDAQTVFDNYHFELFSWHRVTCYGNHRDSIMKLARIYGLEVFEEDRAFS